MQCLFVSDLHGSTGRYKKLRDEVLRRQPEAVFLGGDLLPAILSEAGEKREAELFATEHLAGWINAARDYIEDATGKKLRVFAILGNDDPRMFEYILMDMDKKRIMDYVNKKTVEAGDLTVSGYSYTPPSPFLLKDWERYDISRFVDPGSVSPEEGYRTVPVEEHDIRYVTMETEMEKLFSTVQPKSIFLFHAPPHNTSLDRADLDGVIIDHAPLDPHVGSIAIRRFIEKKQPLITLHGHIHESTHLTGNWKQRIGRTHCFNAAHHGPELCIVSFDTNSPEKAIRELL